MFPQEHRERGSAIEVKGDIEYGLNKLSDGWLLYLINNKGVTKFTNKVQVLDVTKTANVEVSLGKIKASEITELREQRMVPKNQKANSFTVAVPPGDIRVVKIKNQGRRGDKPARSPAK